MSTKMSKVNLTELIKSIYDVERKLHRAGIQLTLLQNSIRQTRIRYSKAKVAGNQAHCYNIYLRLSTLEGVGAMFHHYMEIKGRQLEWLYYYFLKKSGMCWSDYQQELQASKQHNMHSDHDVNSGHIMTEESSDENENEESDMSCDSDAGAEIFL